MFSTPTTSFEPSLIPIESFRQQYLQMLVLFERFFGAIEQLSRIPESCFHPLQGVLRAQFSFRFIRLC